LNSQSPRDTPASSLWVLYDAQQGYEKAAFQQTRQARPLFHRFFQGIHPDFFLGKDFDFNTVQLFTFTLQGIRGALHGKSGYTEKLP
jgi:hypothetical protein